MMIKHVCNMCGKEFGFLDEQENFQIYSSYIGYGSKYDEDALQLDLCIDCMEKIIDMCVISPIVEKSVVVLLNK